MGQFCISFILRPVLHLFYSTWVVFRELSRQGLAEHILWLIVHNLGLLEWMEKAKKTAEDAGDLEKRVNVWINNAGDLEKRLMEYEEVGKTLCQWGSLDTVSMGDRFRHCVNGGV